MREFNVTGLCIPGKHYMVDISEKVCHIVELKLWYGEQKHEKAFEQISKYLDSKNKDIGYLLTFDFRKTENIGKPRMEWVEYNGRRILDVMVGL